MCIQSTTATNQPQLHALTKYKFNLSPSASGCSEYEVAGECSSGGAPFSTVVVDFYIIKVSDQSWQFILFTQDDSYYIPILQGYPLLVFETQMILQNVPAYFQ